MEGVVSQWTAVYKNYIHCSPCCPQPYIILTDGLSLLSRHNIVRGFPTPRLHFSVTSPWWTQETPFPVRPCFNPKDGHGVECAPLSWSPLPRSFPNDFITPPHLQFSLLKGRDWLVGCSFSHISVCVCVAHCLRLMHLGGWHFILLSTPRNQHTVLHSVGSQYLLTSSC